MSGGSSSSGKSGVPVDAPGQPGNGTAQKIPRAGSPDLALTAGVTGARPMIRCPKCGGPARDVARFCPRCHMTLRFECPACKYEQRHGVKCDRCRVDFLKYIAAVVAAKQAPADAFEERNDRSGALAKNLISLPFTLLPLLRSVFGLGARKQRK